MIKRKIIYHFRLNQKTQFLILPFHLTIVILTTIDACQTRTWIHIPVAEPASNLFWEFLNRYSIEICSPLILLKPYILAVAWLHFFVIRTFKIHAGIHLQWLANNQNPWKTSDCYNLYISAKYYVYCYKIGCSRVSIRKTLRISYARKTTICAIIRKSHFAKNCPIPL